MPMPPAIPLATYRLQLTKDFTFDDAAALVPYLKQLRISHLYASPFLKARPGSTHGYDIIDHGQLNPELGGEEAFLRLSDALRAHDLGLILDFVPNHMGVGHSDNAWWLDVLEWGKESPYAQAFDIDWDAVPFRHNPGVLLPVLGKPYGEALQSGEIELKYEAETGSFAAWYYDNKLPINPQRYNEIIRTAVTAADAANDAAGKELLALADRSRDLKTPSYREAPAFKEALRAVTGGAAIIERGLKAAYRGDDDAGRALLHRLLERQNYRIAYWRVAFAAVNYRRFFDINELAGLRVEQPMVFRRIHERVERLIRDGRLQGLRLDHIDGLRDPAQYTKRLQQLTRKARDKGDRAPFYVIVEKILAEGEPLPALPGVAGTTGYEWLNVISHVLADARGLAPLEATWRGFTGEQASPAEMLDAAKRRVIETMLASEFTVLSRALARIAAGHFSTRDYTLNRLREALLLYALEFPLYRTYVTAAGASAMDRITIDAVITRARKRWAGPDPDIFDFLRRAVTLDLARDPSYSAPRVRNFALKLQQFTGPLMAKAMEDTVFYRDHRLLAFNEVGGHPDAHALTIADFHALQRRRLDNEAGSLTATATHDTKRGEDARARILALTELTDDWDAAVKQWRELNAPLIERRGKARRPSAGHEYMIYQALIGAWPGQSGADFTERMQAYAIKAAREGKQQTSWTTPDEDYERALTDFVGALLDPARSGEFLGSLAAFASRTSLLGALNGLSQLALKALTPGVPDFYQGSEFWDLSLVDPDNRRPVDFRQRQDTLRQPADWQALASNWQTGEIKLALTHALLDLRARYADLFQNGSYEPVQVSGPHARHLIAFSRIFRRQRLVVAVGRHFAPLTDGGRRWPNRIDARLGIERDGVYRDLLAATGQAAIDVPDIGATLATIPVAVLLAE